MSRNCQNVLKNTVKNVQRLIKIPANFDEDYIFETSKCIDIYHTLARTVECCNVIMCVGEYSLFIFDSTSEVGNSRVNPRLDPTNVGRDLGLRQKFPTSVYQVSSVEIGNHQNSTLYNLYNVTAEFLAAAIVPLTNCHPLHHNSTPSTCENDFQQDMRKHFL